MEQIPNKKSRIEQMERHLYENNNNNVVSPRHDLHEKNFNLKSSWQEEVNVTNQNEVILKKPKNRKSIFGYVLIFAFIFFMVSAGYAGYVYYKGSHTINADNVDIKIISPVTVGGGEKLSLDLIIQNSNQVELETADLIIEYPAGTKSADDMSQDMVRVRESIGVIASGGVAKETVNAVLFGEKDETKKIIFTLEYRIPGSNAIFEKTKEFEISLNNAPIRLKAYALDEVSSGQEITLSYELESNNTETLNNVLVKAEYPFGFRYISSNIEPIEGNNLWKFEKIEPKEKIKVDIKGTIEGQNEEERVFKFESGVARNDSPNEILAILSKDVHDLKINKSFVDFKININGSDAKEIALNSKDRVSGVVRFTNNTNDVVNNLIIELSLNGSVVNEKTVYVEGGVYDSVANKIRWSSQTNSALVRVDPRKSSEVRFQFENFKIGGAEKTFINPEIRIDSVIKGSRTAKNNSESSLDIKSSQVVRIVSDVAIVSGTQYATGPIVNTGPIPPAAEQETTYTMAFAISNSSNKLENAEMIAKLPPYVSWKDFVVPAGSNITFDPSTRIVKWNIGEIEIGKGYSSEATKVYFKVGLTPSLNQIGSKLIIMSDVFFKANDPFAKSQVNLELDDFTTLMKEPVSDDGNPHENVVK